MYEHYYGLRERPFDLSSNTKFLFLSPQHHEALTHLRYGLSGRPGITLLVGEAGMGKSTLVRAALGSLPGAGSKIVLLSNPTLTRDEFYEFLAREFGLSPEAGASKTRFLLELKQAIDAAHAEGGGLGLIVDEAQSVPFELLEELRLLTNAEGNSGRSLTLILVGQPELSARLEDAALRQLKQRVALRTELRPVRLEGNRRLYRRAHHASPAGAPMRCSRATRSLRSTNGAQGFAAHHQRHLRQRAGDRFRGQRPAGRSRHRRRGLRRLQSDAAGGSGAGSRSSSRSR